MGKGTQQGWEFLKGENTKGTATNSFSGREGEMEERRSQCRRLKISVMGLPLVSILTNYLIWRGKVVKFANDKELGRIPNTLENRNKIQNGLERFESHAEFNW